MPSAIFTLPGGSAVAEFESGVEIAAAALVLLGAKPIGSMLENNENARTCARLYPRSRREVLRMHTWNSAMRRKALARDGTGPLFNWTNSFTLPVSCIRVVSTNLDRDEGGDGDPWEIEIGVDGSKALVANVDAVSIRYIEDITNPNLFDPLLEKAITYDLAAKLAYPVTQNREVQVVYEKMRDDAITKARTFDGQEQSKRRMRSTMLTRDVRG